MSCNSTGETCRISRSPAGAPPQEDVSETAVKEAEWKEGVAKEEPTDSTAKPVLSKKYVVPCDPEREPLEPDEIKWFPDHISKDPAQHPLIPFPKPPRAVELRASNLLKMCMCLKRNGLQSDCLYSGCRGNQECIQAYLPDCVPSGLGAPISKTPFLQKADAPQCLKHKSLAEMGKPKGATAEVTAPPSSPSDISLPENVESKKVVHLRPNSPPNYITDPPCNDYLAPCRRHRKHGIPGSKKYRHQVFKCPRKVPRIPIEKI